MAPQGKSLAAPAWENLSSIPKTHVKVEGESCSTKLSSGFYIIHTPYTLRNKILKDAMYRVNIPIPKGRKQRVAREEQTKAGTVCAVDVRPVHTVP